MMFKIMQAFKENTEEEHWLSDKSEKAVRDKVILWTRQIQPILP